MFQVVTPLHHARWNWESMQSGLSMLVTGRVGTGTVQITKRKLDQLKGELLSWQRRMKCAVRFEDGSHATVSVDQMSCALQEQCRPHAAVEQRTEMLRCTEVTCVMRAIVRVTYLIGECAGGGAAGTLQWIDSSVLGAAVAL